jgi:hypothetical protein
MPPLPDGTMIVYTNVLYLGLVSCVALGVVIGIVAVGWWTEYRCSWCWFNSQDIRKIEEASKYRGPDTTN